MAAVLHDSHHPTKQCTSASCCSPSRLWKSIQSMIANDSRDAFTTLSQDPERAPHLTRVLLTLRAANDPLLFPASHKHRVIQFDLPIRSEAVRKFGKQVTDLNALQLALLQRRDGMAHLILGFLRQTASPKEVQIFVNHLWGQRNSSLHVACFLNMPRLVRLLLDCGADPAFRNARNLGPVDCSHPDCLSALGPQSLTRKTSSTATSIATITNRPRAASSAAAISTATTTTKTTTAIAKITVTVPSAPRQSSVQPLPSLLMKKAVQGTEEAREPIRLPIPQDYFASVQIDQKKRLGAQQDTIYPVTDDLISRPTLSPLSFSSSSSTSSFSSLSSVEEPIQDTAKAASSTPLDRCWSPPALPSAPSPASEWDSWAIQGSLKLPRPSCFPSVPTDYQHQAAEEDADEEAEEAEDDEDEDDEDEDEDEDEENVVTVVEEIEGENRPTVSEKHTHPPRQVHFMPQIVLVDACVRGDLTELTEIIDRTIEQSGIFSMRHTTGDVHNRSLLHLALMHGHESVVRYLVQDANINMNHPDNDGWTALHYAAALGLWDSLEYLASCKEANLQAKTQHGLCIQDCPESPVDRKRCRFMIERAIKRASRPTRPRSATAPPRPSKKLTL
ncbi:hypothetical protein PHYBLDRAFT_151546 [Phycomyces blakesleeanus NRRL 1555(-)]|uniref:Ankyrin repeat-containing protein n=1 Tax=Phycomyces blakesleeanus (strain ATCC 8743b / DSM 1359 / FGSC 10004 / NBRC 33097 / NRRL 1555) TaxID=763407 RepID=A0A162NA98_PHYB8|nr:hypothetical protein PHYBLDRAFT_151546 [Phycomyces blakesleeanus NRRL 1555(-)]OAD67294.1 hypothetical protein PHYBLDRAFT_151546 [Phycomyces blakesleeanus NRRL 1555(-)]|eukprot:XP_018285334.1 hypothetical protein PHYBLDRAFT_151546 [Phycomyces blakesleeanus NRRL 1555(-)]